MINTIEMSYTEAHDFVSKNKNNGFFWDQYTIVKWSPGHNGFMQTNGMYRNGKWGYSSKFTMTSKGTWKVPTKHVKNP